LLGANLVGLLILTDSGRYSTQLMRSDLPKFVSNNRAEGTPEEYKAVALGSISSFGTYTVNEANKTLTIRYEGSTFPNRKGAGETRPIVIEGDELRITNPAPSVGGGFSVGLPARKVAAVQHSFRCGSLAWPGESAAEASAASGTRATPAPNSWRTPPSPPYVRFAPIASRP